ncbi:hypothetical protein AAVH_02644 [Aphelenchoides avenae]|nr:hypothetical protein AAVH_02644 [Aphelenchus avenae]
MLPGEVFVGVLGNLSRADLGSVQQVSIACRDLVAREFGKAPYVHVLELFVDGLNDYGFICPDPVRKYQNTPCASDEDFAKRMKFCVVEKVRFKYAFFDERLLNVLKPVCSAWSDAEIETPARFSSNEAAQMAFDEILRCNKLILHTCFPPVQPSSFFSLDAVRHCNELSIRTLDNVPLNPREAVNWLHQNTSRDCFKELEAYDVQIEIDPFLRLLKDAFKEADERHSYFVTLMATESNTGNHTTTLYNRRTSETLRISRDEHYETYIYAERSIKEHNTENSTETN